MSTLRFPLYLALYFLLAGCQPLSPHSSFNPNSYPPPQLGSGVGKSTLRHLSRVDAIHGGRLTTHRIHLGESFARHGDGRRCWRDLWRRRWFGAWLDHRTLHCECTRGPAQ